jgi:integrase
MPKRTKHPRLRVHVSIGKAGQVWKSWFYDMRGTGERDIALGSDYDAALRQWADIRAGKGRARGTIEEAFARWEREELPNKTPQTRDDYAKHLRHIRPVFGPAAWENVGMKTLKGYLKARSAKVQANREMAVLSIVWRWAQTEDLTRQPWPAAGLERSRWKNPESARRVEVTDAMFAAVYGAADRLLRDYLDIATATGLRVHDVVGLRLSDIRGDKLVVVANKTRETGKLPLEIDIAGSVVLDVLARRPKVPHLFLLADGRRPVTARQLGDRFKAARAEAAKIVPECAGLYLRDCRKRAAQLAGDGATNLLQHSSKSVTDKHYSSKTKAKAAR